jgi:hypothetical protein
MSRLRLKTMLPIVACTAGLACSPAADPPIKSRANGGSSSGGLSGVPVQMSAGTFSAGGVSNGSGGTSAAGGNGLSGSSTGGNSGSSGAPAMCPAPQGVEAPLPLIVSPNFIPSGYFAGPEANLKGIKEGMCEARPADHKIGKCYKYTFQATALDPASEGAYGGVFWQYGANNWGSAPGMKVVPGATKVTFKAWSASAEGGEAVKFSAGGIGTAATLCADGVNLGTSGGTTVTLTTTPTEYSIDLTGQTYQQGIIGGFVWSAAVTSLDDVVSFYVDEIQWTQ